MSQHTAGPWEMPGTDAGEFVVCTDKSRGKRRTIAHVYDDANARLIAAATTAPPECDDPTCSGAINKRKLDAFPELLINLQTLTDRLMRSFSSGYASAEDWRLINEASAAIVKATE